MRLPSTQYLVPGPGTMQTAFAKYSPMQWVRLRPSMWPDKAHNEFLDVAVQMGLLGLGAYLWLLFAFCRSVWPAVKREVDSGKAILCCACSSPGCSYHSQLFPFWNGRQLDDPVAYHGGRDWLAAT